MIPSAKMRQPTPVRARPTAGVTKISAIPVPIKMMPVMRIAKPAATIPMHTPPIPKTTAAMTANMAPPMGRMIGEASIHSRMIAMIFQVSASEFLPGFLPAPRLPSFACSRCASSLDITS